MSNLRAISFTSSRNNVWLGASMRYFNAFFFAVVACLFGCTQDVANPNSARTDGFVTTDDGVGLYYVEAGSGSGVLIAPLALYLEPHLLDRLATNMRIIFFDPRNRGQSDRADLSSISLDRQLQDLEALRDALGIEEMALLGWSAWGMEMAAYTLRHPNRVTRLIQMSPIPPAASIMRENGDARAVMVDRTALESLDRRNDVGEFAETPEEYCRLRNAITDPAYFVDSQLAKMVLDVCVHQNEWRKNIRPYFNALFESYGEYDWRDDLKSLRVPRLVIHGREDNIPVASAKAWVAGYPEARLLILSPSGHVPYIEKKEAVIEAIETFLGGEWPAEASPIITEED